MNCTYCGYFHEHPTDLCARCGATMVTPTCDDCGIKVDWGEVVCEKCSRIQQTSDKTPCPSCGASNSVSAEYCTKCGTPMAVITRVMTLARARDREPLDTWRVYGIETSIVGRESELDRLNDQYESVLSEKRVRFVKITAPTGLGKSRLLAEFQDRLNQNMSEAHVSHAASRDETGGPYSMFSRLIRDRFYIDENEHPERAQKKLVDAVSYLLGSPQDAERVAHLVGQLIDIHFDESPFLPAIRDSEGAQELDRRCFEALTRVMVADARRDPLIVILEDLQYATNRSLDLIQYLSKHLDESQILFILSWSPDELINDAVLFDLDYSDEIDLAPLSDEEVDEFVRTTLHKADTVPRDLVSRITEAAHGNPLIVEEILRILISQGIIDTRFQEWKIDVDRVNNVDMPKSMEGAVHARIHTLTEDEVLVLNMAACVGNVFWPEVVRCLFRLHRDSTGFSSQQWSMASEDDRCEELLESLERKDMIRRHSDSLVPNTEEMAFKHRIERTALYDAIAAQDKQRYHRLIAQWLEQKFPESTERIVDVVAAHFDRARALEHAASKYLEAADFARLKYQNQRAIDFYVKGLSYLSDADIHSKISAFAELGGLYHVVGEYDQSLAYFREMLRYAWLVNDQIRGAKAYNQIARAYSAIGEYDLSVEHLSKALELFKLNENDEGIAETLDKLGLIHWIRGNFDEAATLYESSLQIRRELNDKLAVATSLAHIGGLKMQSGDYKGAMTALRESLSYRKEMDDQQGVVDSYNSLAVLCVERGQFEQALRLLREALDIARDIGYRGSQSIVLNNIGDAYLHNGETDNALIYLNEAAEMAELSGDKRVLFDVFRNLSKAALKKANRKEALEKVNEALVIANQLDSQLLVGLGMHALADAHAQHIFDQEIREESTRLAEECYKDAIAILRDVGNEGELGRALTSYGRFLVERGSVDDGRETLQRAKDIFQRLELTKLVDSTESIIERIPLSA